MNDDPPDPIRFSRGARFRMEGPADLLEKLYHDIQRIAEAKARAHAAYATIDAAITAWSIPDWCFETREARGDVIEKATMIDEMLTEIPALDACRMIATAAKHRTVTRTRAIDVENNVVTFRTKAMDPASRELVKSIGHVALIYWNGESHEADQFFGGVAIRLAGYLRRMGMEKRSVHLDALFDEDI